jgi:hypothetical protein
VSACQSLGQGADVHTTLIDQVYGALQEVHHCPGCGDVELRRATPQLVGAPVRRSRDDSE